MLEFGLPYEPGMKAAQQGREEQEDLQVSSKGKQTEGESFVFSCTPINRATLYWVIWLELFEN